MGYKALKIEVSGEEPASVAGTNEEILENKFYKLVINKATGSISSLFDKELNQELADRQNPYNIGQADKRDISEKGYSALYPRTSVSNVRIDKDTKWSGMGKCEDLSRSAWF